MIGILFDFCSGTDIKNYVQANGWGLFFKAATHISGTAVCQQAHVWHDIPFIYSFLDIVLLFVQNSYLGELRSNFVSNLTVFINI